jgi:hypothetical protein
MKGRNKPDKLNLMNYVTKNIIIEKIASLLKLK